MSASTKTKRQPQSKDTAQNGRQEPSRELSELLQQQISEALEPVVGGLRDQMVETVRAQLEENLDADQLRELQKGEQRGGDRAGKRQQGAQKQQADGEADTQDQQDQQDDEQQSPSLLSRIYQWLSEMIHQALSSISEWFSSLVDEVRRYVIRTIGTALMAMLRPILKAAIQKAFDAVQQQGKDKLMSLGQSPSK
jgi:hypothetical protein